MSDFHDVIPPGDRRVFASGMERDTAEGKGRFDLVSAHALFRLAKHYENGSKHHKDRNWELGAPLCTFYDSAMRHLVKWMMRWSDEDHLAAVLWNVAAIVHFEELGRTDLDDRPDWAREDPTDASGSPEPYRNEDCALCSECPAGDCNYGDKPWRTVRPSAESL